MPGTRWVKGTRVRCGWNGRVGRGMPRSTVGLRSRTVRRVQYGHSGSTAVTQGRALVLRARDHAACRKPDNANTRRHALRRTRGALALRARSRRACASATGAVRATGGWRTRACSMTSSHPHATLCGWLPGLVRRYAPRHDHPPVPRLLVRTMTSRRSRMSSPATSCHMGCITQGHSRLSGSSHPCYGLRQRRPLHARSATWSCRPRSHHRLTRGAPRPLRSLMVRLIVGIKICEQAKD